MNSCVAGDIKEASCYQGRLFPKAMGKSLYSLLTLFAGVNFLDIILAYFGSQVYLLINMHHNRNDKE